MKNQLENADIDRISTCIILLALIVCRIKK